MPQASILKPSRPAIPQPAPAEAPAFAPLHAFAMLSDRGRVRHANQDACGARPERGAFALCDGMGGVAGGDIASQLALDTFLNSLAQPARFPPKSSFGAASTRARGPAAAARNPPPGQHENGLHQKGALGNGAEEYPPNHPHARLEEAVRAANHAVYRHSQRSRALRGMGTTLVALLLDDAATLWLAHVGDSRCYRLRAGVLRQLTQDHSLVEEQIQAGLLSRVQASSSPVRNIITRAIGSQPTVEPEIAAHSTQPGDLYLLASDGLTRELDDDEIAGILCLTAARAKPAGDARKPDDGEPALRTGAQTALDQACQALIDAANAKGGGDNITVVLIHLG